MKIVETTKPVDPGKYDGFGPAAETRYVIADDRGNVVDDAQGYGYRTKKAATKAMRWKFGKGRTEAERKAARWKARPELVRAIRDFVFANLKEIARGELTEKDVLDWCEKIARREFSENVFENDIRFLFSKAGSKMVS